MTSSGFIQIRIAARRASVIRACPSIILDAARLFSNSERRGRLLLNYKDDIAMFAKDQILETAEGCLSDFGETPI